MVPKNVKADYCVISDVDTNSWNTNQDDDEYDDTGELLFKISNTNDAYDTELWITWSFYRPDGELLNSVEEGPYTITDGDSEVFKKSIGLFLGGYGGKCKFEAYVYWQAKTVWSDSNGDDLVIEFVELYSLDYSYRGPGSDDNTELDSDDGDNIVPIILIALGVFAIITISIFIIILVLRRRKKNRTFQDNIDSQIETSILESKPRPPVPDNSIPRPPRIPIKKTSPSQEQKPRLETFTPEILICPYCGKDLNFPKKPKFCPYCKEQISI